MVGAPAAADAVERARRLPGLGVGLHLVLVDGRPVLPPEGLPDLVDADGRLGCRMVAMGIAIGLRTAARLQMEAEVRAQFAAFARTGLRMDHVNGHHHFHVHPSVFPLVVELARTAGASGVRVPYEPVLPSWLASRSHPGRRLGAAVGFGLAAWTMKRRLTDAGLVCADSVFGLNDSGAMDRDRVSRLIDRLPEGVTELYCHPSTETLTGPDAPPSDYRPTDEFNALTDPEIAAALRRRGLEPISFAGLAEGPR